MKIFIDTNVFYNDWFMRNANFKYLFHFLNNERHTLILSNLVIQESENIRERELADALSEIRNNIKKVQKLNSRKISYDENSLGMEEYNLLPMIESRVEIIELIDYEGISHAEVVDRALKNKKPFMEGEKGYRDTLIWLSFLEYLAQKQVDGEVAFITNNKSDFFKTVKENIEFHPDLSEDIQTKGVSAKILPFTSLFNFINSAVDKNKHAIDYYASEEIFEEFIESSAVQFIEGMSNTDLAHYLESSLFETTVKDVLAIRADVLEGLEDPEVMNTHRMEGNEIYVGYQYNLRRVTLEIDIPEMDYILNKDELKKIFYDAEIGSGIATLSCLVRPYFDVSFIYNEKEEDLKNYEVADLWLRR